MMSGGCVTSQIGNDLTSQFPDHDFLFVLSTVMFHVYNIPFIGYTRLVNGQQWWIIDIGS
jgi:hypothetical protein